MVEVRRSMRRQLFDCGVDMYRQYLDGSLVATNLPQLSKHQLEVEWNGPVDMLQDVSANLGSQHQLAIPLLSLSRNWSARFGVKAPSR